MKCKQASELISLRYEEKLAINQHIALHWHLLLCARCRHFQKNSQQLHKMLKHYCEKLESDSPF